MITTSDKSLAGTWPLRLLVNLRFDRSLSPMGEPSESLRLVGSASEFLHTS